MKTEFVPLDLETRPLLTTAEAAHFLNRKPQTLRDWACHESGPLQPVRMAGRLGWKVDDLRKLLDVSK